MKNKYLKQEFQQEFQKKLKEQIRQRRRELSLSQTKVAEKLGISRDTYQHWEKPSQFLNNIFDILSVFQILKFSTTDIIEMLGLEPLTASEMKAVCQDEDMLKSIQENTIYSVMREKCPDMDDWTLEKLFFLLEQEHFERLKKKQRKP